MAPRMSVLAARPGRLSLRAAIEELRRLRAENTGMADQLAELRGLVLVLIDAIDHEAEFRGAWLSGFAAGQLAEFVVGQAVQAESLDVSEPKPYPAVPNVDCAECDAAKSGACSSCRRRIELDQLRYPPNGRARYGEARPGDFAGTETLQ